MKNELFGLSFFLQRASPFLFSSFKAKLNPE